jgi:hypothetical protein
MDESFDRNKIIESMFDPITSGILAELEDGGKELSYLAKTAEISEDEVNERLSYFVEYDFVKINTENEKIIYSANSEKLGELIENNENFDGAVDGLTKMDSYLN